jgi:radical SAM protein with 4Fe4S-binding SPASM domain
VEHKKLVFDNILESRLESIIHSDAYVLFMREIDSPLNLHSDCRSCSWLQVCKGGHPATKCNRFQNFSGMECTWWSRQKPFNHIASVVRRHQGDEWAEQFRPKYVT